MISIPFNQLPVKRWEPCQEKKDRLDPETYFSDEEGDDDDDYYDDLSDMSGSRRSNSEYTDDSEASDISEDFQSALQKHIADLLPVSSTIWCMCNKLLRIVCIIFEYSD